MTDETKRLDEMRAEADAAMSEAAKLREKARGLYAKIAEIEGMTAHRRMAIAVSKASLDDDLLRACFAVGVPSLRALGEELRAAKLGTSATIAMARVKDPEKRRPMPRAAGLWIQRRLGKDERGRWRYPLDRWWSVSG